MAKHDKDYEQRLQAACKAVKSGKYKNISRAAEAHSVDRVTLGRRLQGSTTSYQESLVSRQLLTPDEEKLLKEWIIELVHRNVPARVGMLNDMAKTILEVISSAYVRVVY